MKKIKNNLSWVIITSLITLVPMFLGLILWNSLPAEMATHFNAAGEADGYSSKAFAVFFIPILLLAVHIICLTATAMDPKNEKNAVSEKIYRLILLICPAASIFCTILMYGNALHLSIDVPLISQLFIGLIFVILGNYMPKVHQNYTVGVKLPWTLDDPGNWNRTNRLFGWISMIFGLLFILNGFLQVGGATGMIVLFVLCIVSMLLVPTIYSYMLYLKRKSKA